MESGLPIFKQDVTCPVLLKNPKKTVPIRGYHPLWLDFPVYSGCSFKATGLIPVRSPLLRESLRFPFLRVMRCFSSPGLPPVPIYSKQDPLKKGGSPIRKSQGQRVLAPRLGLSQPNTSFIASMCQGIHQMPFLYLNAISIT